MPFFFNLKLLILVSAGINLILSLILFWQSKKNKANFSFALFAFFIAIWSICFYFYFNPIVFSHLIWIKIVYLIAFPMIPAILYFSFYFPQAKIKSFLLPGITYTVCTLPLIWLLLFTDLWVKEIIIYPWGPQTVTGNGYFLFFLFVGFWGFLIFYNLAKSYFSSSGIVKTQLKFIFFGIFLFGIFSVIADIILPLIVGTSRYFWLSPIFSLFIVSSATYAITRYRLMDIRIIIGRGAVYFLSFATVIGLAFVLMFLNGKLPVPVPFNFLGPALIILSVLLFNYFQRFYERIASKYFYYVFYSYQSVLTDLSKRMTQILDINELTALIIATLINTMKLERTVVLLRDPDSGRYQVKKNVGFKEENGISLVRDSFLTTYLEGTQKPLVYEELSLAIKDAVSKEEEKKIEQLRQNMKKIEAALCLPLFIEGKITGMIVLGNKLSGDPYSKQDIELLVNLSSQASISLQNAKLYSQVDDLSYHLQEKVDEQMKELKEAYEELRQLDNAKSEFISMASHQLRTPLTAIKGYVSMVLEGTYGELPRRMHKPLKNVLISNDRLVKIVNDLLNISKIELGKMELEKELTQVEELVKSCYEEMKIAAEKKNLKISLKTSKDFLPKIEVDQLKLRQVISNLIDNAIRYTSQGSVEIEVRKTDSHIHILVKDTGEGLNEKEKKEIFGGFIRGTAGVNFFVEGAGLGLYVAKKFLSLHNGKIWAESEGKGKGSTFYVELPITNS